MSRPDLLGDASMKIGPRANKTANPFGGHYMRILNRSGALALTLAAALMSSGAWADNASPVGLWKNVDDVSGKPRAPHPRHGIEWHPAGQD
jgi:hypothetical protein